MDQTFLLGIDVGTTGLKTVLIQKDGQLAGSALREYPILTPRIGWAEQDPEIWMSSLYLCVRQMLNKTGISASSIRAIGLAGQMHSLVCIDRAGKPVRPAILWADQRSNQQAKRLSDKIGKENLAKYTGNPIAPGFMAASWVWLLENEKETVEQTRCLLLPKDYVRFRLTGEIGSEPSDASSTLLFDTHQQTWSTPMLDAVNLLKEQLPPISPSHVTAGGLARAAADQCGLIAGTPVVFGGSDVSMQAFSQGLVKPGVISCTIGTGGQLFAPLHEPSHDALLRFHLFCHVLPSTWHHEAAILTAGMALRWLRDGMFQGETYQSLADLASTVQAGTDNVFFFPYLAGERTPYMDARLSAGFLGFGLRHHRAHLIRAVMEGVVFSLRRGIDLMEGIGTPASRILSSGGGTNHPLWIQLQANIFNRPIYISNLPEATARGAAILAGIGAGVYQTFDEAVNMAVSEPDLGAAPDPDQVEEYQKAYSSYVRMADTVAEMYLSGLEV